MSDSVDDFASRTDLSLTFETGPVDESTYILKGDATVVTDGDRTALAVNDGYAALGKLTSIAAAPAVTVAFDFNRTEMAGSRTRLFWNDGKYGVSIADDRYIVSVMGADGKMRAYMTPKGTAIENGQWTGVALVLDSATGTLRFYVNDVLMLAEDGLAMGFAATRARETTFGGAASGGSGFTGLVDDLRIWDEALSAEQVANIGEPNGPVEVLLVAADAAAVAAGGAVTIDVLANDDGAGGLRVTGIGTPAGGTVTLVDGALHYQARAGFWGVDRFSYTVTDEAGQTGSAEVAVTVGAPDPLRLGDDAAAVAALGATVIDVLANDDGHGALQITDVGMPSGGTVALVDGALHYRAETGFWGEDRFEYTVTDAFGQTGTAEVVVRVAAPDPLALAADSATVAAGGTAVIDVLANDDGHGALRITGVGTPSGGTATLVDGTLHYEAGADFAGQDRFSYTVTDAFGQTGTAEVTVTAGLVVDTPEELMAALQAARGGETILLAPGDYGRFVIDGRTAPWATYGAEVTVRSLDPDAMARFTGLSLRQVANVTLDSISFDYVALPDAADDVKPFQLLSVTSVKILDSVFEGDIAVSSDPARNGFATGHGLWVRWSTDVLIEGSDFFDWHRGAVFDTTDRLVVRDNAVHSVRSDGFDFVAVRDVLIEGNTFRDFLGSPDTGDHRDMIQFWTNGTTRPSVDVTIRGNVFDSADGSPTQTIFMRNEEVDTGRAGDEMFYRNVRIEDNLIRNAHAHGITVGETIGLVIANNTVAHSAMTASGLAMHVPKINVKNASQDVTIVGNYVDTVTGTGDGWIVADNVAIQRTVPGAAGYYGDIFTDGLGDGRPAVEALRPYPGSDGTGAGGAVFDPAPGKPDSFVFASTGGGLARGDVGFRIGTVVDSTGGVSPAGATVLWDFGDGTTSTEFAPTHRYAEPGLYDATARITLDDGRVVLAQKTVQAETPVAVLATFDGGLADLSGLPNRVLASAGVTLTDGPWGTAVRMPGGSELVTVGRSAELRDHDGYTVMLDFSKADAVAGGRLVYFTSSFVITLGSNSVTADVVTDVKSAKISATHQGLATTDWRHLALTFDGQDGVATVYLDGTAIGSVGGLEGAVQRGSTSHDLLLGGPFGGGFAGDIDNFVFLRGALSAEEVAAYAKGPRPDSADDFDFGPVIDLTGGPWTDLW